MRLPKSRFPYILVGWRRRRQAHWRQAGRVDVPERPGHCPFLAVSPEGRFSLLAVFHRNLFSAHCGFLPQVPQKSNVPFSAVCRLSGLHRSQPFCHGRVRFAHLAAGPGRACTLSHNAEAERKRHPRHALQEKRRRKHCNLQATQKAARRVAHRFLFDPRSNLSSFRLAWGQKKTFRIFFDPEPGVEKKTFRELLKSS